MTATVYILENSAGTVYVGATRNLERRLEQHRAGKSYLTSRGSALDWELFHSWTIADDLEALKLEQYLKEISHEQAIAIALDCPNYGPYLRCLVRDVHISAEARRWHSKKGFKV